MTRRQSLAALAKSRGLTLEPMTTIRPRPCWYAQGAFNHRTGRRAWVGSMSPRATREGLRAALEAMPVKGKRR